MTDGNFQCGSCDQFFDEPFEGKNCPNCGSGNWVVGCIDEPLELTDKQTEQIDHIHSIAFNAMKELLEDEELTWDMVWIGEIADTLCEVAVRYHGKTEMAIYPYVEGIVEKEMKQTTNQNNAHKTETTTKNETS